MKALVVGGGGLLGKALVRKLKSEGHEVIAAYRPGSLNKSSLEDVETLKLDLRSDLGELPARKDLDTIIFAAQARDFRGPESKQHGLFEINTFSPVFLANYALRCEARSFYYCSTGGVYAPKLEGSLVESDPLNFTNPSNDYVRSKIGAELLLQSFAGMLSLAIFRPFFIYGPGQERSMLLPRIWDAVRQKKPIEVSRSSPLVINPIHVDDAAEGIVRALGENATGFYNLAGPDEVTLKKIAEIFGKAQRIEPIYKLRDEPSPRLVGDTSRLQEFFLPRTKLEDSVAIFETTA